MTNFKCPGGKNFFRIEMFFKLSDFMEGTLNPSGIDPHFQNKPTLTKCVINWRR